MILKISALASGAILLDGSPVDLAQLDAALLAAKNAEAQVWYYREAAGTEPPPQAMDVMKLVVKHKLPIRLSTNADFSNTVDPRGSIHSLFDSIRKIAADRRAVVILRPDGVPLIMQAPPETSQIKQAAADLARMIPPDPKRNIAVMADTSFTAQSNALTPAAANQAIPFFGMLIGFAFLGHTVWIFNAGAGLIAGGCREADFLIVDGGVLGKLPAGWQEIAAGAMRNANITVHDRNSFQLKFVRKVGTLPGTPEFPNGAPGLTKSPQPAP